MMHAGAILAGALLLVWPALLNGYPLVFIDTVSYLDHMRTGEHPWDKTAFYGVFLLLSGGRISPWLPVVAQGLACSSLIWLAGRVALGEATPRLHLLLCAGLALLTTAPWFTATLMPDAMTGWVALSVALLGFGEARLGRAGIGLAALAGTVAIAAHLSHVPVAGGLILLVLALRRRVAPAVRAAVPLAAALALLVTANLLAFGRPVLSAHGAVFLLARLQADGPVVETLRARCRGVGWELCGQVDALPMDSDAFLWGADSPLNRDNQGRVRAMGGVQLAAEARQILAATFRDHPLAVARAMGHNTLRQIGLWRLGDTLGNTHLDLSARGGIERQYGAAETARFDAGAQMQGRLPGLAAPFAWLASAVVPVAVLLAIGALSWRRSRPDPSRLGFVLLLLAAVAGNAFATGALSAPHDRYGARSAWLLPLAAALALMPGRRPYA